MKQLTWSVLAAALLAAAQVPAQISIAADFGRHARASVRIGGHQHHGVHHDSCRVRRPPAPPRGHWQTIEECVLVPGYWHDEHVPPTYGWIYDRCGHRHWGMIDPGGCRRTWVPARWETRHRRVWVAC